MSVTNPRVELKSAVEKNKNDSFTLLQALALILLTVIVSFSGWYAAGQLFFWKDLDIKRVDAQLEFLEKRVEAEPRNLEHRVSLAYTYFLKGDNDQAVKELNQVLAIDKKYSAAYYNLGLVYSDEGRANDALEMFQKTVELSPQDHKGHLQKGILYREMKMYKEAVESLETANKILPGNANVIYEIGRVAEEQGNFETAITIYKEALSYDPLYKDAVEALKRVEKKR